MNNINTLVKNSSQNVNNFEEMRKVLENENLQEILENGDKKAENYTQQFIDNIRDSIYPLYKKINVANKWSFDVADYMNISIMALADDEHTERHLIRNVTPKTYIREFKDIIDNTILLIGKILLPYNISYLEIDKILFLIDFGLRRLDNLRDYLDSYLHDDTEWANSEDFADLTDDITNAQKEIANLYDDWENEDAEFGYIDSNHIPCYASCEITKIRLIYDKLLQFHSKVINLDCSDVTYPYWVELQQFGKNLYDNLTYATGMAYMDITGNYDVETKGRNAIIRCFERLERKYVRNQLRLNYMLKQLKAFPTYGNERDKELLNAYEELKETVKNTIFSSWN